jgi:hypothetical protein
VEDVDRQRKKISSLCPSEEVLYQESKENLVSPFLWSPYDHSSSKEQAAMLGNHDKIVVKRIHRKDKRSKNKKTGKSFRSILLRGPADSGNSSSNGTVTRPHFLRPNATKAGFKMVVYQVRMSVCGCACLCLCVYMCRHVNVA